MKKIAALFLCLSICLMGFSQRVSLSDASKLASDFFHANGKTMSRCAKTVTDDQRNPLFYVFNAESGFVVVSADNRVAPVLAFSDHQLYNDEDVIPPVKMWLDYYAMQIASLQNVPTSAQDVHPDWQKAQTRQPLFRTADEVSPLMKSHWGQGTFYNYYCPRDFDGENGRVVTGCVATAMAQLIYYFRFPERGVGSYSYVDENYGPQSADYGAATYDYDAMCDEPTAINPAISTLIRHFGVGVDMVYGPDGSGMYNHSAARVLREHFKYSPETEYLFRDSTTLNWDSVIVAHLERNIPMYYAGWSEPNINGHGFICDGYKRMDSCYYFHFNFGWDGSYDGYFYTDGLNLMSTHFNFAQELIVNAYPDTAQYAYPSPSALTGSRTFTTAAGSFTDGSLPYENYAANMDYYWHIRPAIENMTAITVDLDYDIAAGDTLCVLPPAGASVLPYYITGDSGTVVLNWEVDSVTVRFVSASSPQGFGFRANYTTSRTEFCESSHSYTHASGTIADGSEGEMYNDFTECKFRIITPSYSSISLRFREFDLEEGHDFLYVFDNSVANDKLLATFTGTMPDTTIIFDKKRLALLFETDEQNTAQGFTIDYAAGYVGVDDYAEDGVTLYPNPATDVVVIESLSPMERIVVRDLQGRTVMETYPLSEKTSVPVTDFSSGVYLVQIFTNEGVISKKMFKR